MGHGRGSNMKPSKEHAYCIGMSVVDTIRLNEHLPNVKLTNIAFPEHISWIDNGSTIYITKYAEQRLNFHVFMGELNDRHFILKLEDHLKSK